MSWAEFSKPHYRKLSVEYFMRSPQVSVHEGAGRIYLWLESPHSTRRVENWKSGQQCAPGNEGPKHQQLAGLVRNVEGTVWYWAVVNNVGMDTFWAQQIRKGPKSVQNRSKICPKCVLNASHILDTFLTLWSTKVLLQNVQNKCKMCPIIWTYFQEK